MSFLRKTLSTYSRYCVVRRKLPDKFGGQKLYIATSAALQYWLPREIRSPQLFGFAEEFVKAGSSVWDVGANVGVFSFAAAHLSGKTGSVLAIEPDYWLCSLLVRNALRQDSEGAPVQALAVAVSERSSITKLNLAQSSSSVNFLDGVPVQDIAQGSVGSFSVVSVTLDSLLDHFEKPDVLKLDIEGAELLAFRGATKVLQEVRPVIHCEVSSEHENELTEIFQKNDYSIYDADQDRANRTARAHCAYNTLAIPNEHPGGSKCDK